MKSNKHVRDICNASKDQLKASLKLSEATSIREKEQSFKLILLAQNTLGHD